MLRILRSDGSLIGGLPLRLLRCEEEAADHFDSLLHGVVDLGPAHCSWHSRGAAPQPLCLHTGWWGRDWTRYNGCSNKGIQAIVCGTHMRGGARSDQFIWWAVWDRNFVAKSLDLFRTEDPFPHSLNSSYFCRQRPGVAIELVHSWVAAIKDGMLRIYPNRMVGWWHHRNVGVDQVW